MNFISFMFLLPLLCNIFALDAAANHSPYETVYITARSDQRDIFEHARVLLSSIAGSANVSILRAYPEI